MPAIAKRADPRTIYCTEGQRGAEIVRAPGGGYTLRALRRAPRNGSTRGTVVVAGRRWRRVYQPWGFVDLRDARHYAARFVARGEWGWPAAVGAPSGAKPVAVLDIFPA